MNTVLQELENLKKEYTDVYVCSEDYKGYVVFYGHISRLKNLKGAHLNREVEYIDNLKCKYNSPDLNKKLRRIANYCVSASEILESRCSDDDTIALIKLRVQKNK